MSLGFASGTLSCFLFEPEVPGFFNLTDTEQSEVGREVVLWPVKGGRPRAWPKPSLCHARPAANSRPRAVAATQQQLVLSGHGVVLWSNGREWKSYGARPRRVARGRESSAPPLCGIR